MVCKLYLNFSKCKLRELIFQRYCYCNVPPFLKHLRWLPASSLIRLILSSSGPIWLFSHRFTAAHHGVSFLAHPEICFFSGTWWIFSPSGLFSCQLFCWKSPRPYFWRMKPSLCFPCLRTEIDLNYHSLPPPTAGKKKKATLSFREYEGIRKHRAGKNYLCLVLNLYVLGYSRN